ncbi:MAG: alpha/beta hydrolase [Treponema sp.]|uniref:alpha/beta hydrolase n=1 Tax=Treponema sp. TaxID=166 RepID=UPI0025F7CD84|nr:alpha/beta hydrolase [Treponema sp.]MBR0496161.1 alpha/beta hydrolase [Treponema sp.]
MKKTILSLLSGVTIALLATSCSSTKVGNMNPTSAKLDAKNGHYTFELPEGVTRTKVTFRNHFGIELAGDLYTPENASESGNAAVAVAGPYGAVKEQTSGLHAAEMAKRGFIALAFDPSFTGESGGEPRGMNAPNINTEDFQAAVDFLSVQKNIDPERIGIIGICGWGGYALDAAAIDTRIKASLIVTMYDMSRVFQNGYFDAQDNAQARQAFRKVLSEQRTKDFANGTYQNAGGWGSAPCAEDAPQHVKDYYAYYRTKRGYHERSVGANDGFMVTTLTSLMNTKMLPFIDEIESAVLMVHGEKAHSRYFSEDNFKRLKGDNKELLIIPGAVHTDLYDNRDYIPFDKYESFFTQYLK